VPVITISRLKKESKLILGNGALVQTQRIGNNQLAL